MNKRRMKHNSYLHVRKCIDILNGKIILIHELPPGGVYWGQPNGRGFDTFEGRDDKVVSLKGVSRHREGISGKKDICYSADSSR